MVSRSEAFKIVLMIKGLLLQLQPDKQTNSIPYYVTAYLEVVWPTVRKLLHACILTVGHVASR